jgi:iron(III) transport system substrate-binding protein
MIFVKFAMLFGCAFLALASLAGEPLGAAEARPGWQAEWQRTLELAKKEGQVVMYAGADRFATFREFQKKYPEIKFVAVPGSTSQLSQRVASERRAGKYLADLYISGSGVAYEFYQWKMLDPIRPVLILPEVLDETKWWSGKHLYHDDEGRYIFAFNGNDQSWFSYNTKLVNPKEIGSYWDFLNARWKGRIVTLDPTLGAAGGGFLSFFYHNPRLGPDFIRRLLGEMDLTPSRDMRQMTDWLAVGKYAIAIIQPTNVYDAKNQGLPVANFDTSIFKEGAPLSTTSGNIALFNNAPHPNASRVLINWLLSREGQIAFQINDPVKDSLREDIPKDMVPEQTRRKKGVQYLVQAGPQFLEPAPINRIVKEVWRR